MPIIQLQRMARLPELGRIRMGYSVPGKKEGQKTPKRSDTWILTAQSRELLESAAERYGGKVEPWPERAGYFRLVTSLSELPVWVLPLDVNQWGEFWADGECQRRCDGENCTVPAKDPNGKMRVPARCLGCFDSDTKVPVEKRCVAKTRASVMLPGVPGLGVWRLETASFYAGVEIPGTLEWVKRSGHLVCEAVLAIEIRRVRRGGQTKVFPVAQLRVTGGSSLLGHLALESGGGDAPLALEEQAEAFLSSGGDPDVVVSVETGELIMAVDVEALLARYKANMPGPIGYIGSLDVPSLDELEDLLDVIDGALADGDSVASVLMRHKSAGARTWDALVARCLP